MTQQQTTAVQAAAKGGTQVASQQKSIDVLKSMLSADSVKQQFNNALGKHANKFIASVIDLYNTDSGLRQCQPKQVICEALKAAVLNLPINKSMGFAYVIAYNNSKKDEHGNWTKVMEPTFQIGYKGYIQLALRTGQYRTINADVVYEGELRTVNKLTGEISFDGEKTSDKIVGYFCYIELLNGFSKTLYMTVEQMAKHAKRFSKSIANKRDVTAETLMALASMPLNVDSKEVGWTGNFHGMALKTVIRNLLSKYGYLSVEMQTAIDNDIEGDRETQREVNKAEFANKQVIDAEDASYEELNGNGSSPAKAEQEPSMDEAPY